MNDLSCFVINLKGSDVRLQSVSGQRNAQNITFTRVDAVDGRRFDLAQIPAYDDRRAVAFMGRKMQGGELGCFMSHIECAKQFLMSDAAYGLVLEDDVLLSDRFRHLLSETVSYLKKHQDLYFHLINLGNHEVKIATPVCSIDQHVLYKAHYFPLTTTAILWSRPGAAAFVQKSDTIYAPVDNFFRDWLTRTNLGLAFSPPLARNTGSESEIDPGGTVAKRKRTGRSPFYGLLKQKRLFLEKYRALRWKYLG